MLGALVIVNETLPLSSVLPLLTVIVITPVLVSRLLGTVTVRVVDENEVGVNVVADAEAGFQVTTELELKLLPVTTRVKGFDPTGALVGATELRAPPPTLNVMVLECTPLRVSVT
jgi:hypothetical protein